MKRWLRRIPLLLIGVVVVGLVVYAFLPTPVGVDLAPATRGSLRITVDEDGKTRIKEHYVVSSPLTGRVLRVVLDPGDRVEQGKTLLAVLEPSDPSLLDIRSRTESEARVQAAEAGQKRATASLARAEAADSFVRPELERARQLLASRSMSHQDLDNIALRARMAAEELRVAQFGVQIADFELKQAQAALLHTRPGSPGDQDRFRFEIHSPIDGRVLRVFQESSTVVSPGTRLLEVGDPTDLEVEVDVLSTDAVKINPGARVLLEHWGGDRPLVGRVRLVEPAAFTKISALGVEEQRVWVIIDFEDPPNQRPRLGDAYRVETRIVIWEESDVLKIPAGALFRKGEGWAVFAVVDGKAVLRPVTIGHNNGLEAQVLDGLQEGEPVVVHPSDRIQPGVGVQPR